MGILYHSKGVFFLFPMALALFMRLDGRWDFGIWDGSICFCSCLLITVHSFSRAFVILWLSFPFIVMSCHVLSSRVKASHSLPYPSRFSFLLTFFHICLFSKLLLISLSSQLINSSKVDACLPCSMCIGQSRLSNSGKGEKSSSCVRLGWDCQQLNRGRVCLTKTKHTKLGTCHNWDDD